MQPRLNPDQIKGVQQLRYEGKTNDEIRQVYPQANDSLIGTYAPSELRGGKRRLAKYIGEHPGIDFKDINFRAFDVAPNRAAGQIQDLRRAGLITFKEGRIAIMKGDHHTAGSTSEKGMYDLRLTEQGIRRVEASAIAEQVATKHSLAHAEVAAKLRTEKKSVEPFRLLPPEVLATRARELNADIDKPQAAIAGIPVELEIAEAEQTISDAIQVVTNLLTPDSSKEFADREREASLKYPILTELRKREGRIHAANRLVGEALTLYDSADLTEEAIALLEHLRKTDVKFTAIESELMKLAEDKGI